MRSKNGTSKLRINGAAITPGGALRPAVFNGLFKVTQTVDLASVAATTRADQDITVSGVKVGDVIIGISRPALTAGLGVEHARVSAANTVTLTCHNATGAPIDQGSGSWTFLIARVE